MTMKNVLVIFEHQKHIDSSAQRFIEMLIASGGTIVNIQRCNNIITTNDIITGNKTVYKLIGCGFPYCYDLGDKLFGWKFDCIMIHSEVVLTKKVEWYIRTRMKESKDFIEFE